MQMQIFEVPCGDKAAVEELNLFLRTRRVLTVEKAFMPAGGHGFWSFCVEYLPGPAPAGGMMQERTDYKKVLGPDEFARFSRLRAWRKETAEREGLPAYAIFTNEQLAAMARGPAKTLADLGRIEGVGPARIERHGAALLEMLSHEKNGQPDRKDSGDGKSAGSVPPGGAGEAGQTGGA